MTLSDYLAKLPDPSARIAREQFCVGVTRLMDSAGRALWAFGLATDDPKREALALVAQMAASLSQGAALLYSSENWYAGAGLVRQLVETEYLMFLFSTDAEAAARWRASTSEERRTLFTPAKMRKLSNGVFRDSEYWAHCDRGGHPTPLGQGLLSEHRPELGTNQWLWIDLAQHLERFWGYFDVAIETLNLENVRAAADARIAYAPLHTRWQANDPCAGWVALPNDSAI